ncbi:hypothetical protein [uncultured Methylobacterium sp.]|uniref:ribonuclease toxin HepT-like protein n=1 Tax=uncultured Methylobacterium sp. TaxID=157278 RepID=UPI0035CC0283
MIASRQPVFAKLGPKLERAGRERANLDAFLARYDTLPADRATAWGRLTAIAAAVHNAYDGVEDVLLALANDVDGALPTGDTAHQDLLDQMRADIPGLRPAVLDDDLYIALTELKGFRHRVRHNYGFDLDAARTEQNRMLVQATFPKFVDAIRTLERLLTA